MSMIIYQDHYKAWTAESSYLLEDGRRLDVRTKKSGHSLVTMATVCKPEGAFDVYMPFSDFYKRLCASTPKACTKARVEAQHEEVLKSIADTLEEAKAFYAAKEST